MRVHRAAPVQDAALQTSSRRASSWARSVGVGTERLTISVAWEMVADRPKRIARIAQTLHWPELPRDRLETADCVARLCPIHATLNAGTEATTRVALDPRTPPGHEMSDDIPR